MSQQGVLEGERGFTLIEVIVTIIIMGIVFSIASSIWLGAIESRKVDSATNQLAADLRQAHTRATNRLEDWHVIFAGDSTYTIRPTESSCFENPDAPDCIEDIEEDLDDDDERDIVIVDVDPETTITFKPDGSAVLPGDSPSCPTTLAVSSADGDPNHCIDVNAATSEIDIAP